MKYRQRKVHEKGERKVFQRRKLHFWSQLEWKAVLNFFEKHTTYSKNLLHSNDFMIQYEA